MRHQRPSRERSENSLYGESNHEGREIHDERKLYGEPCHEVRSERDEQTLYGDPQHETPEESCELPDLELLFARLRAEPSPDPTVFSVRSGSSQTETTGL